MIIYFKGTAECEYCKGIKMSAKKHYFTSLYKFILLRLLLVASLVELMG